MPAFLTVEMRLADKTPDNSIPLFDKGFDSLGLFHHWMTAGENRHWLLPLKENTEYEVVCRLGRATDLHPGEVSDGEKGVPF